MATDAYTREYLSENLIEGLRPRLKSLKEYYKQSKELLGEGPDIEWADGAVDDWLWVAFPSSLPPVARPLC